LKDQLEELFFNGEKVVRNVSFALVIGLGTNYLFGLWQADPIVGLIIVIFLVREGYETLREEDLDTD